MERDGFIWLDLLLNSQDKVQTLVQSDIHPESISFDYFHRNPTYVEYLLSPYISYTKIMSSLHYLIFEHSTLSHNQSGNSTQANKRARSQDLPTHEQNNKGPDRVLDLQETVC